MHSPHNNPLALFVKGKLMEVENFSHQSSHTVNGKKLFPFDTYFNENLNYMKCIHIMRTMSAFWVNVGVIYVMQMTRWKFLINIINLVINATSSNIISIKLSFFVI